MAFQGLDLRDLWRRGSGLTLRRLGVLIAALPPTAPLWAEMAERQEKARQVAKQAALEAQQVRLGKREEVESG